ncbi:MAG TPA: hypothetical protein VID19_03400 [Candidatus Eremiobacteraceae bacterium]|jgi:hypothetical protein
MRIRAPFPMLGTLAAFALFAGCSGNTSTLAPNPVSPHSGARSAPSRMPSAWDRLSGGNSKARAVHRFTSFDACPAQGPIVYASDDTNNVVNIYAGKFAGQAPCGQIADSAFNFPFGLSVKTDTHDLYVANGGDVLVFHRGQTSAYNTYVDPSNQAVNDVVVAKDGTIVALNYGQIGGPEAGSISTWIGGPNGGTFVGNFPLSNDIVGGFLTVQKNGTIYFNDLDNSSVGLLWKVLCPAGACGAQTQVAGVSFAAPAGLASDDAEDLLAVDQGTMTADTFELPNPTPKTFALTGIVFGMALSRQDHHWFVADALNNVADEYAYPSGHLIGTVPGSAGGNLIGVAIDPGHAR